MSIGEFRILPKIIRGTNTFLQPIVMHIGKYIGILIINNLSVNIKWQLPFLRSIYSIFASIAEGRSTGVHNLPKRFYSDSSQIPTNMKMFDAAERSATITERYIYY